VLEVVFAPELLAPGGEENLQIKKKEKEGGERD